MPELHRPFRLRGLGFWSPVAFVDKDELRHRVREWKNGAWLVVYYLFILMISRVGDYTGKGMHVYIPFPWDSILVATGALFFYYWGIASAMHRPRITVDEDEE